VDAHDKRRVHPQKSRQRFERLLPALAKRLGDAAFVCRLLSRNGIIVLATYGGAKPQEDCLEMAVDPRDTPDFAAEKILHGLEEKGVIERASADYTPQEEEEIRRRLADLGYIE